MSDRLKGKRAFVTAGAAGIRRACAIAFAREGATVFATDIDEKGLAPLKSEGVAEVAKLDAPDTAAVRPTTTPQPRLRCARQPQAATSPWRPKLRWGR